MTPKEYVDFHGYKPLTPSELNFGKDRINIYNTETPMPWDEIYTRIAAGMDMEHIAHIYGQGRKIALWAIKDGIEPTKELAELLDSEIEQRRKMAAVEEASPIAAATLHEMANEYAPDAAKNIVVFSNKLVQRATNALGKDKVTSLDLVNLAKAVQTASDILGHTQRHASAAQTTHNQVYVEGFTFKLGTPPVPEMIEAEVEDDRDA